MTRGRRPNLSLEPSRQLLVQRAFRERKAAHLRNLEESVQRLERENAALKRAMGIEDETTVEGEVKKEADKDDSDSPQASANAKRKRTKSNAAQGDDQQAEAKTGGCCGPKKAGAEGGCSTPNGPSSASSQPRAPAFCPRCFERDRNKEEITTSIGQVDFHLATLATAMVQLRTVLGRAGGPSVSSLPTPTSMEWSTSVGRSAANAAATSTNGRSEEEELARTLSMFASAPPHSAPAAPSDAPGSSSSTAPSPAAFTLGSMSGATQNLIATMRRGQRRQTVGPTTIGSMPSPSASSSRAGDNNAWGTNDMSPPAGYAAHSTPSPASQYGGGAVGTSSARSTVRRPGTSGHGVPDYSAGMHARRTSSSTDQAAASYSPIEPTSPNQAHVAQYATPGSTSSTSSHYAGLTSASSDVAKRLSASSSASSGASNATSPYDARTPRPQSGSDARSRQSSFSGHGVQLQRPSSSSMPSYMSLSGSMHGVNGLDMPMHNPALANPTLESELGGAVAAAAAAAAAAAGAAATATGAATPQHSHSHGLGPQQFAQHVPPHHHHTSSNGATGSCPHLADDACCLGLFNCDEDGRVLL